MAEAHGERRVETEGGSMQYSRPLTTALLALWAIALLAASCGGSTSIDEVAIDNEPPATEAEPAAETQPEPDPEPTATPEPEPEPEPTEAPATETTETNEADPPPSDITFWADALRVGDCFSRAELTGELGEIPETISCDELHEEEIYAVGRFDDGPSAPYPGDSSSDRVWDELCEAATTDFAGRPFDELPFSVYTLFPTEEEWEAGDRGIMCSAASDVEGRLILGSAAGSALDVDADLVVRIALATPDVGEFEDWGVIDSSTSQSDTISLTDGSFDLQLRRPSLTSEGVVFNATQIDDDGFATTLTTIDLSTGEFGEIPVPVEGFEYSSTVGYGESLVFAARENDEADWNVFGIFGDGDAGVIGDTDADEHYPTLSGDGQIVVFHRDGDLWRSNIDGSEQLQLTDTDANEWESEISPDGESIVFVSDRAGNDDLWLMTIDGDDVTQLTDHAAADIWPTWSRDGSHIFFASDRFSPEGNHSSIMVLDPESSDLPSYFSTFMNASHPVAVDSTLADNAASVFPTLDERYFGPDSPGADEVLQGEPGTLATWLHSSGRLGADLPAGWSVREESVGEAAFLAAPDIDAYFETWGADAVFVSLHQAPDVDAFIATAFGDAPVLSDSACTEIDSTGGPQTDGGNTVIGQIFDCGSGSNGQVLGIYNPALQLGVVIEGQRDNVSDSPGAESDEALLNEIAASIVWS